MLALNRPTAAAAYQLRRIVASVTSGCCAHYATSTLNWRGLSREVRCWTHARAFLRCVSSAVGCRRPRPQSVTKICQVGTSIRVGKRWKRVNASLVSLRGCRALPDALSSSGRSLRGDVRDREARPWAALALGMRGHYQASRPWPSREVSPIIADSSCVCLLILVIPCWSPLLEPSLPQASPARFRSIADVICARDTPAPH